ncbi:GNAT family N-acetyltransferase [Actinokineospora diospyrosa]|uniref:Acetyltransferase (GNAT) family protein n=1 Tax=Actinokineospora diospyrosa TaxID=103728 RepID=A0ABT1IJE8_9PSEU|nr:GNAT family N-acetyltransferase [Actinokineospora diospyrosa]MCP2272777.1 Acetyltransferase (GNAT) family protein [Actinokineospora diospyrosa]
MDLTWRSLEDSDAPAWVRLMAEVEAVDRIDEHNGPEDFAKLIGETIPEDTVAVLDGDTLVAYGLAFGRPGAVEVNQIRLIADVAPSHRRHGVGTELVRRLHQCAKARHARQFPDLRLEAIVPVHERNAGLAAVVSAAGYTPSRWFFDMRAKLTADLPRVPVPDGFTLERYRPEFSEPLRLLRNDTFAEHWGSTDVDVPFWEAHFVKTPPLEPTLSAHLRDNATGELAAFVLTQQFAADTAARGFKELWITDVGTRTAWRGRGLASALLSTLLNDAREAGFASSGLSVDADNQTGALGVYERAGYAVSSKWTQYTLPLG